MAQSLNYTEILLPVPIAMELKNGQSVDLPVSGT